MHSYATLSSFPLAPAYGKTLSTNSAGLPLGPLSAGTAQAACPLPNLRRTVFRYRCVSPWRHPTVREVVRKMIPGTLGVAAFQLNVLITSSLGYYIDETIVASFDYAVKFM